MKLNKDQNEVINSNDNLLVIAGAGCGKTHCITTKVLSLLKKYNEDEILIISFTNETVNNLKKKLPMLGNIFTFHKLAINILPNDYKLINSDLLWYTINEFFISIITKKEKYKLMLCFLIFNYDKLLKSKNLFDFKKVIFTFINLLKCNNYDFDYLKDIYINKKDSFFIGLIIKIYLLYNNEKNSQNLYDLDDLIIKATNLSKKKTFNYKYIFVDEFQDTSQIRFKLVYTIFKNSKSIINLFGDDYQSIYAFSGCDLNIMLNIKDYIPNISIKFLNTNYRSDNNLIQKANKFIIKNDKQINKKIHSDIFINNSINYIYYTDFDKSFNELLNKLQNLSNDILILGRYNHDIKYINSKYKKLTIHQSKGLEADFVIITNLKDELYGFPSKVKYNHLLKHVNKNILAEEERRLFYVAITRCKKKVYLMIPHSNKSSFINEIKKL